MSRKRKRSRSEGTHHGPGKRCTKPEAEYSGDRLVRCHLLSQYYSKVCTLRDYLLFKLPESSKVRRNKIRSVGCRPKSDLNVGGESDDAVLGNHLDQVLVGVLDVDGCKDERWKQWTLFSQPGDVSESTLRSINGGKRYHQSEIVDFSIWQLFKQNTRSGNRSQHLLCQGFRKDISMRSVNRGSYLDLAIPGVVSVYPNHHVTRMKEPPWPAVLNLMGREGQRMMIDLILDCGTFVPVQSGRGNYHQLSGIPLGELQISGAIAHGSHGVKPAKKDSVPPPFAAEQAQVQGASHSPARIMFVRNRILYARAGLNSKGAIKYGLCHIHVLNRHQYGLGTSAPRNNESRSHVDERNDGDLYKATMHVMMYIFPRQFGLHNVFTCSADSRETMQPLKDYTVREEEISSRYGMNGKAKVPKRLRGRAKELVKKLQISHSRCPYKKLLDHYCSVSETHGHSSAMAAQEAVGDDSTTFNTQIFVSKTYIGTSDHAANPSSTTDLSLRKASLMDYATPKSGVSAFCRAVLCSIVPDEFWGLGNIQAVNKTIFLRRVDQFINLRRFETFSMHDAVQGMQTSNIPWLAPQNGVNGNLCFSESQKRLEIFLELVYFLFDSILIPLIRAHFYVTESNVYRNRLFFFRHDKWRSLSEPALASIKSSMLEEMDSEEAKNLLNSRTLGFSRIRLLPKETGVRPIMNLKQRPLKKGHKYLLGSSINSLLGPVHNVLQYEKNLNPDRLGSSLFSVIDFYPKLKAFGSLVASSGKPLYFVKVDVRSAFDTIPQYNVLELMCKLPGQSGYRISKHAEIKLGDWHNLGVDGNGRSKPTRKWISLATSPDDFRQFDHNLESNLAVGKANTVFVDNVVNQYRETGELLNLLSEHVKYNLVKIGKRIYRQKKGIPQGSVLSSFLCNYFYADLEAQHLSFLDSGDCLLRLIDDFLLITTDQQHAKRFLAVMHAGVPEYGVSVNPAKTLVNFEVSVNNMKVTRLVGSHNFPYCGSFINTKTLDIKADREKRKDTAMEDSLTVEFSKTPGRSFQRKAFNAFTIQAHAMLLDTSFNSLETVFSNIYDSFIETATKMWHYARCLPLQKQPQGRIIIGTVERLIEFAFVLIKSKGKNKRNEGYKCAVSRTQVEWLAVTAFKSVLQRRQSKYGDVIAWLNNRIVALRASQRQKGKRLIDGVSGEGERSNLFY